MLVEYFLYVKIILVHSDTISDANRNLIGNINFHSVCWFTAQISLTSHAKPNGNLYHSILKMTSNLMTRHKSFVSSNRPSPHCEGLALMFKLLANTVVCLECRAVLKKVSSRTCIHTCTCSCLYTLQVHNLLCTLNVLNLILL